MDNPTAIRSVAVLGVDFIDLKPDMWVAEGDQVKLGQVARAQETTGNRFYGTWSRANRSHSSWCTALTTVSRYQTRRTGNRGNIYAVRPRSASHPRAIGLKLLQ